MLKVRAVIWLSGAKGLRAALENNGFVPRTMAKDDEQSNILHVRGVGGVYEDEGKLLGLFEQFGEPLQAVVRHRIDEKTGANTSWALVTMATRTGAEAAFGCAETGQVWCWGYPHLWLGAASGSDVAACAGYRAARH